jgi:hypothetical protein
MRKAAGKSWMRLKLIAGRARDRLLDTRSRVKQDAKGIRPLADIQRLNCSGISPSAAAELARMWLAHRFDLLGSGWVKNAFTDNAPGLCGHRYTGLTLQADSQGVWLKRLLAKQNLRSAQKIWQLVTPGYQPVDWQKDVKSGYRFNAATHFSAQKWADKPGGDIKVLWELSRLQHLPRMAVFAKVLPEQEEALRREFRDQCLDFIAQNPPRMGVNWVCTMDVGLRAANMALAYSLFVTGGAKFDAAFQAVFLQSLYEHCEHIRNNLEWSELLTSNHYLANVTGLLCSAVVLPPCPKREEWIAFAAEETLNEIAKQFHAEGSNFEGSTAYHRLSGDMSAYTLAVIAGQGIAVPDGATARIAGAARFLEAVTRPDGAFSQIGDNDSGLFFRLSPTGGMLNAGEAVARYANLAGYEPETLAEPYYDENMNDAGPTIAAIHGLFDRPSGKDGVAFPLERSLTAALCRYRTLHAEGHVPKVTCSNHISGELPFSGQTVFSAEGPNLTAGLSLTAFPSFGVYIFRSPALYLLVNASDNGQKGNAGHCHNDKLSYELFINGNPYAQDPGTFVYTALPEERERYRGTLAHNTIYAGEEQNSALTLFSMKDETRCFLLGITEASIDLLCEYRGIRHHRSLTIEPLQIIVRDYCNKAFSAGDAVCPLTAGYGKVLLPLEQALPPNFAFLPDGGFVPDVKLCRPYRRGTQCLK